MAQSLTYKEIVDRWLQTTDGDKQLVLEAVQREVPIPDIAFPEDDVTEFEGAHYVEANKVASVLYTTLGELMGVAFIGMLQTVFDDIELD